MGDVLFYVMEHGAGDIFGIGDDCRDYVSYRIRRQSGGKRTKFDLIYFEDVSSI